MKTFLLKCSYSFSFLRPGCIASHPLQKTLYLYVKPKQPYPGLSPTSPWRRDEQQLLDLTATLPICFLGMMQHINLPRSDQEKGRNTDACSAIREDSHRNLLPLLLVFFGLPGLTGLGQIVTSQLAHQIGVLDSVITGH